MSTQPFLFPETPEIFVARLDSEILALLMGHAGGPLSLVAQPTTDSNR